MVAGATQAEATERLRQAGLPLGTVRRIRAAGVPGGHAIGTKPMAGETLRSGERVTLVLSSGASPASVADLIALIDANPRAAGTRAPAFRTRLARLDALDSRRRRLDRLPVRSPGRSPQRYFASASAPPRAGLTARLARPCAHA